MQGDVDRVLETVLSKLAGCNRLFKTDFLSKGWRVEPCGGSEKEDGFARPCVKGPGPSPAANSLHTYEIWKEGVFFACEQTVGRYRDDIVSGLEKLSTTA